jgi:hypothetical protein
MAEIVVRLLAGDDEERSFFLSQEFSSDVARLPGVSSHAPSASPDPGKRGDPITLGAIIIAAVSGGGALTALVSTIGSYLARDRRTEVEVATPDGRKLRISSQKFQQKENGGVAAAISGDDERGRLSGRQRHVSGRRCGG